MVYVFRAKQKCHLSSRSNHPISYKSIKSYVWRLYLTNWKFVLEFTLEWCSVKSFKKVYIWASSNSHISLSLGRNDAHSLKQSAWSWYCGVGIEFYQVWGQISGTSEFTSCLCFLSFLSSIEPCMALPIF